MARPTLKKQLELPGGATAVLGVRCGLRLVASVTDPDAWGYALEGDVGGIRWANATTAGLVTFTEVRPNSGHPDDAIVTPEGTVYELTTRWPDGRHLVEYLDVPDQAGDVWVPDILATEPGSLLPAAAASAADLEAEETARLAGDTAEAAARAAADTSLQSLITAEATTRAAGDTAEATARAAADTAEATTRAAGDSALLNALLLAAARTPEQIVSGAITINSNQARTAFPVRWPDGTVGQYTALVLSSAFPGAVDSYQITYGSPVSRTYTQPTVTRDAFGGVSNAPDIQVT
jgi:hypothetical protein